MIGDSVSLIYWGPVNESLSNSSNVQAYHAPINGGDTAKGLSCIQEWLGDDYNRWDIITYNFGMWNIGPQDVDPKVYANGTFKDSALERYVTQLRNITVELMKTKAGKEKQVFFVTTNPTALVPECCVDPHHDGLTPGMLGTHSCVKRIAAFNEAAIAMLRDYDVGVIDLYGCA